MRSLKPAAAIRCLSFSDKRHIVDRDVADDDGGEVGIFRQKPAHGLDEEIAALLAAHPSERPDPVFARQAGRRESRKAVGGRPIGLEIDAVMDDGRGPPQERGRRLAGRDDGVHPRDEEVCVAGFCAAGRPS